MDGVDGGHSGADFIVAIVKMRRDANAGLGPKVDLDIARQQLAGYFPGF